MALKNIWIPSFVEDVLESVFFSVEIADGSYLSKDLYSALFFHKLVSMISDVDITDLIEDIEIYFPSVSTVDKSLSSEDIAVLIIESDEFYYGFPPVKDDEIKLCRLEDLANKEIGGLTKEEFFSTFEENYNLYGIMHYVTELTDSFLAENSEHVYDSELSLMLMTKN